MQTPKFLRAMLQSSNYWNKNSEEFAKANEYLEKLFPGQLHKDATGQYIEPEYDMTYEQFLAAQEKFNADIEEALQEAESEQEETDAVVDYSQFVVIEEIINVHVLMPWGDIENKQLIVYTLNIPEDDDNSDPKPTKHIWIWHSENDDSICDDCALLDNEIFENKDEIPDVPVHPNCRCWIEEQELDDNDKPISSKVYKGKKPDTKEVKDMKNMDNFEKAYNKLKEPEGGYTDGKNQVRDEPTNMGIKQSTLDKYIENNPNKDFPQNVKDLTADQAREIYKNEYWDNTKIPQIENDRIRNAVFDMNVMSGLRNPTKTVQRTLNEQMGANLPETGYLGEKTVKALNAIPEYKVTDFMDALKTNRIEALQKMINWPTAKNGWTKRTNAY